MSNSENESLDTNNNNQANNESSVRHVLSPGSMLRQKREASNLELAVIARELNLDPWMLTALEADEFSKFGAQVFAKGHLKHYAQHLGLNPEDVLFAYYQVAERKETTPVINKYIRTTPHRKSSKRLSKWFIRILALLTVGALIYGAYTGIIWWLNDARENSATSSEIQNPNLDSSSIEVPPRETDQTTPELALPLPEGQVSDTDNSDLSIPSNDVQIGLGNVSSDLEINTDSDASSAVSDQSVTTDSTLDVRQVTGGQDTLQFDFQESSWVEVFTESGERLIYGMANSGAVRQVKINGPTEIFLGNALGTVISLNGKTYNIPENAKAGRTARFVLDTDQ